MAKFSKIIENEMFEAVVYLRRSLDENMEDAWVLCFSVYSLDGVVTGNFDLKVLEAKATLTEISKAIQRTTAKNISDFLLENPLLSELIFG